MDEERPSKTCWDSCSAEYPAPKTNGFAIASPVLGVLGLCAFLMCAVEPIALSSFGVFVFEILALCAWVLGLALGIVAITQIRRDPERLRGMGLAIAGTVLSGIMVLAVIITPLFARTM